MTTGNISQILTWYVNLWTHLYFSTAGLIFLASCLWMDGMHSANQGAGLETSSTLNLMSEEKK